MRATKYTALCLLTILSLAFLLHGTLPQVSTGSWIPANSLAEARSGSAAVVLDDGRVLFTGGTGSTGPLASAELFHTDGSISVAAPMLNPRTHHTAVVLKDGSVLVAGGTTSGGGTTSAAEIYDPAGNSWTAVPGGMTSPRSSHTASLLSDGRVLLAGGATTTGATNTLEIYSPATGSFTAVTSGMLSSVRQEHAAAVLADGRVLIAGGSDGAASLNSTDIFDPATGSVAAGPAMTSARAGLSATTLLDGKVLLAGGNNGSADLSTAEVYNASAGSISATGGLATPRRDHLALLLPQNNGVLITGGSSAGAPLASAELFYPWTGAFTATGAMASPRTAAAGAALKQDGYLLVAGGSDGTNPIAGAELYGFATIKTDKADYAPGEIVTISGTGWQPGETVTLSMVESPLLDTHGPFTAVADSNGNIANIDFVPDAHDYDILFYLTARGSVSQAQTTFTDAGPANDGDGSMTVSPLSVTAGSSGNTLTFRFTADNSKDFKIGSQATILVPAGWTAPTAAAGAGHVAVAVGPSPNCTTATLGAITGAGPWTIPINMTCPAKAQFTVTYSGVTAPSTAGSNIFTTKTKQNPADGGVTLIEIGSSPVVNVNQAPAITSANSTTFTVGTVSSFAVTTTGFPTPTLTRGGVALPSGVTFTDNGDGTGTLSGTPAAGTGGTYAITFTAANGVGSNAVQNFTLTVNQAPAITSANNATFKVGTAGSFTVTTTGFPAPTLSESGALPSGVTFNAATGVLSGTPAANTGGTYPITFTASNGITPNATQSFTLTVNEAPGMTSASNVTFTEGNFGSFNATATGFPAPTLSEMGTLPNAVTFVNGLLSGAPDAGTAGNYPIQINAANGVGSNAQQSFMLNVAAAVCTA